MIWDNFSIFRTNCGIARMRHTRVLCLAGEMASEIPEIFYAFDSQLKAFVSLEILLKYFRM